MRRNAKVDDNQAEIVASLRQLGYTVQSLAPVGKGCPDILVGARGRNFLFEIKDPVKVPSKRALTPAEAEWHARWAGQVQTIENVADALFWIIT